MPRIHYNPKPLADGCRKLSIFCLNREGALKGHCTARITWTSSVSRRTTAVQVGIDMEKSPYVRIQYTATDSDSNSTDYDYQVSLTSTPCYLGGVRWWFVCPACGRRIGLLYLPRWARAFRCRHCYNLTYESRNENNRGNWGQLERFSRLYEEFRGLRLNSKRLVYGGRVTKKSRRRLALLRRLEACYSSIRLPLSGR